MKKITYIFLLGLLTVLFCACGDSKTDKEKMYEGLDDDQIAALDAAYDIIQRHYYPQAEPEGKPKVEKTAVPDRYRIVHGFTSEDQQYVFRIYLQRFGNTWEYGTLEIETRPGGKRVLTTEGNMKSRENQEKHTIISQTTGNIDHKIVNHSKPNYIYIFTPDPLAPDQILTLYDNYKSDYDAVYFTTDLTGEPESEYLGIVANTVFDYRADTIENLDKYRAKNAEKK